MDAAPWGILSVLIIFFIGGGLYFFVLPKYRKEGLNHAGGLYPIRTARRTLAQSGAPAPDTAAYEMGANGPDLCLPTMCCKAKKRLYDLAALGGRMLKSRRAAFRAMVFRAWSEAQRSYTLGFWPLCSRFHPCTYVEAPVRARRRVQRPVWPRVCEVALDSELHEQDGLGRAVPKEHAAPPFSPKALAEVCELLHVHSGGVRAGGVAREALADCFHDFAWLHGMFCAGAGKRFHSRGAVVHG